MHPANVCPADKIYRPITPGYSVTRIMDNDDGTPAALACTPFGSYSILSLWRSCVILRIPPVTGHQPAALSSALRQIETVLGGKLVNRTASAVTLTELGHAILPHAQRVLSVAQLAFDDMQQIVQAGGDGTVRIGLVPSVSSLLFPLLPQTLAQAFPRLRVEFHDQTNDALVAQLLKGQIDFGIGALDNSVPKQLDVFPLQEDPFVAVLHCDDPLAASAHVPRNSWWAGILPFSQRQYSAAGQCACRKPPSVPADPLSGGLYRDIIRAGALEACRGILPQLYTTHLQDPQLKVVHLQQPARRARWR